MQDNSIFDSPEFAPEYQSYPWLQVVHSDDDSKCGLFITAENAAQAEITIPDNWRSHTIKFKSGKKAEGFLFNQTRLLLVRSTPLRMYRKKTADTTDAGTFLGSFDPLIYRAEKSSLNLKTKRLVFLLNEQNEMLHAHPVQITTSNTFGASFSEHLKLFQGEFQKCFGRKRNEKFLALTVFAFQVTCELKGDHPNTAWVASVTSHEVPSVSSWQNYFLGYNETVREKVFECYDASAEFLKLKGREEDIEIETEVSLSQNGSSSQGSEVDYLFDRHIPSSRDLLNAEIESVMKRQQISVDSARSLMMELFGVKSRSQLSEVQLTEFLDELKVFSPVDVF